MIAKRETLEDDYSLSFEETQILVDTSVWISHLRSPEDHLLKLLRNRKIVIHPFVIGEIACNSIQNRSLVLRQFNRIPKVEELTHDEVMTMLEMYGLTGRGIGYVDLHLIVAALVERNVRIWSRDKRLTRAATEWNIAYEN